MKTLTGWRECQLIYWNMLRFDSELVKKKRKNIHTLSTSQLLNKINLIRLSWENARYWKPARTTVNRQGQRISWYLSPSWASITHASEASTSKFCRSGGRLSNRRRAALLEGGKVHRPFLSSLTLKKTMAAPLGVRHCKAVGNETKRNET